jgi:hypothetical protein
MGRPAAAGVVFYLGRLRWRPGDPPELRELLAEIERAGLGRHDEILRAALIGGMAQGRAQAAVVEDGQTADTLDGLLEEF